MECHLLIVVEFGPHLLARTDSGVQLRRHLLALYQVGQQQFLNLYLLVFLPQMDRLAEPF
jgi:hypothetical protein